MRSESALEALPEDLPKATPEASSAQASTAPPSHRSPGRPTPVAARRLGVALVICALGAVVILALTYLGKQGESEGALLRDGPALPQDQR